MWWMAIPAAMQLGSSLMQADASRDATRAQTGANRDALNLQRIGAISQLQQMYPIYQGQTNALNRLYGMQGMPQIKAAELNALLQPYQDLQFTKGGGSGGGSSLFRQLTIDPLGMLPDSAERLIGDPLGIF